MSERYEITAIKIHGNEHGPVRIRITSADGSWDEIDPSDDGKVRLDDVIVGAFRQLLADLAERDARIARLQSDLKFAQCWVDDEVNERAERAESELARAVGSRP